MDQHAPPVPAPIFRRLSSRIRTFQIRTFRSEITAIILLISLAVAFAMLFAFNRRFTEAIESATIENSRVVINQARTNIETYLAEMFNFSKHIEKEMNRNPEQVDLAIERLHELLGDVEGITVFDWKGDVLYDGVRSAKPGYNIHSTAWVDIRKLYTDGAYFSEPHVQDLFVGQYPWVVSLCRLIEWTDANGARERGLVVVDISFTSLQSVLREASSSEGYMFVINKYANMLYHPYQQLIYLGLKREDISPFLLAPGGYEISARNGARSVYTYATLDYSNWRIVSVEPLKNVFTYDADMGRDIFTIVFIMVVLTVLLAFNVSHLVSHPINRLTGMVHRILPDSRDGLSDTGSTGSTGGALQAAAYPAVAPEAFEQIHGTREIRELGHAFHEMLDRNTQLMDQIVTEQEQIRRSELKALQAQINPHFLYNTLDSIVWMAENKDSRSVVTMTTALAEFFRLSISNSAEYLRLEDEFRHARSYLTIQENRYKDKFDYEIDIAEETRDLKVVKLLLQPLIENAIYHGMEGFPDKCRITLTSAIVDGRLRLQVIDNGWGMDGETCRNIFTLPRNRRSGIGIGNVQGRIQLYYGPQYGLEFLSEPEEGTTVNVWLPLVEADK